MLIASTVALVIPLLSCVAYSAGCASSAVVEKQADAADAVGSTGAAVEAGESSTVPGAAPAGGDEVDGVGDAGGAGGDSETPAAAVDAETDTLLDAIEAAAADVPGVRARVLYATEDAITSDTQTRVGTIDFLAAVDAMGDVPATPSRFRVAFTAVVYGDGGGRDIRTEYVYDGRYLSEVDFDTQSYHRYDLARGGAVGGAVDPLRFGEGPVPIPLGLRKADVLARYEVTLLPAGDVASGEAGERVLRLVPRPGVEAGADVLELVVDAATHRPVRVRSASATDGSVRTVTLVDADWSAAAADASYSTDPPDEATPENGWHLEYVD